MTVRKRLSKKKEKTIAAKLYAGRNEAGDWDETSLEAQVQPHRAVVTSLRLPVDEFTAVQKAAKGAGQTVSEFIRAAIGIRLRGVARFTALQIATGAPAGQSQATVLTPNLGSGQTRNPDPETVLVPMYVND